MPKGDPVCYPTRVGDKLVHQLGENHELTQQVLKVEKVESGLSVSVQVTDSLQNSKYVSTVIVSARGVQLVEYAERKVDPPLWWLKLPHGEGNNWTGSWPGGTEFAFSTKDWEVIEVPAGKYRAIRVDRAEAPTATHSAPRPTGTLRVSAASRSLGEAHPAC